MGSTPVTVESPPPSTQYIFRFSPDFHKNWWVYCTVLCLGTTQKCPKNYPGNECIHKTSQIRKYRSRANRQNIARWSSAYRWKALENMVSMELSKWTYIPVIRM